MNLLNCAQVKLKEFYEKKKNAKITIIRVNFRYLTLIRRFALTIVNNGEEWRVATT